MSIPNKLNPMGRYAFPYKRKLEYLESTGTQWINLGFKFTSLDAFCEIGLDVCNYRKTTFGLSNNNDTNWYASFNENNVNEGFFCGSTRNIAFLSSGTAGMKRNITIRTTTDNQITLTENNNSYSSSFTGTFLNTSGSFCLWTLGGYQEGTRLNTGRIWYCRIWENGILKRNVIPVLDNNNVPCMYDKVSRTLFYNQGTGQFLYG